MESRAELKPGGRPRRRTLCALLAAPLDAWAGAEPLRVCVNETPHFPWRLADADGRVQRGGLDFVFLDLLAQRSGLAVRVSPLPWKRCLAELLSGEQDMVFGISYLPERQVLGVYPGASGAPDESLAVRRFGYSFYVRRDSPAQWDGRRLRGLGARASVAVQPGFSIGEMLRAQGLQITAPARSSEAHLRLLLQGKSRIAALQVDEADRVLAEDPALRAGLRRLDPQIQQRAYFAVFSHPFHRRRPEQVARLWRLMVEVRDSEAYRRAVAAARP